ncbi:MAG: hypothetical protein WBQ48_08835, partial [Aeromicrobium sp.]
SSTGRASGAIRPGLLMAVLLRADGSIADRRAGVMAVVERGGDVSAGQPITVIAPDSPRTPLEAGLASPHS